MFALAAGFIFLFECSACYAIVNRFSPTGDVEEFLSNAPLSEIIKFAYATRTAFAMLIVLTIEATRMTQG